MVGEDLNAIRRWVKPGIEENQKLTRCGSSQLLRRPVACLASSVAIRLTPNACTFTTYDFMAWRSAREAFRRNNSVLRADRPQRGFKLAQVFGQFSGLGAGQTFQQRDGSIDGQISKQVLTGVVSPPVRLKCLRKMTHALDEASGLNALSAT